MDASGWPKALPGAAVPVPTCWVPEPSDISCQERVCWTVSLTRPSRGDRTPAHTLMFQQQSDRHRVPRALSGRGGGTGRDKERTWWVEVWKQPSSLSPVENTWSPGVLVHCRGAGLSRPLRGQSARCPHVVASPGQHVLAMALHEGQMDPAPVCPPRLVQEVQQVISQNQISFQWKALLRVGHQREPLGQDPSAQSPPSAGGGAGPLSEGPGRPPLVPWRLGNCCFGSRAYSILAAVNSHSEGNTPGEWTVLLTLALAICVGVRELRREAVTAMPSTPQHLCPSASPDSALSGLDADL